ncbi:threonine synthase [Halosegnis longus]|uniref:Threonine synthase n=1 Tax=Halosegnis longus TaxID=2216012 RepID=A0AAJ4UW90_9EURY|nr:threonine synthase [Halosegnis longus]RNJ26679.1 threonine synthase [Salella cibi]
METTDAFTGLRCTDCETLFDAAEAPGRCPDCGGILDPEYDYDALDVTRATVSGNGRGLWRYESLLPFPESAAVTLDEGNTPLVEAPNLAEELGVGQVYIKDEGRNPTGTFKDRGQAMAVTAAAQHDAETVALATAGNAGQAASAYAANAGMDSETFIPTRASFVNKAMINVHGGEMTVVEGRIGDAGAAYENAIADHPEWHSVKTFVTPYRHEGKKTMLYETVEQLDWEVPDHVVYPTGGGVGLVGMHKAATELQELGLTDDLPAMWAAQSDGCAPIVKAFESGAAEHEPWEQPDTICGGIEIPDPGASPLILDALEESGGGAVATPDKEILEAALTVAQKEGVEMGVTCSAATSGAQKLAEEGAFGEDDIVVLLNTGAGSKDADVIRSHLMSKGI